MATSDTTAAPGGRSPGTDPGPALCLSGGGFRATLMHLGALIRLNEMGVLSRVGVITSVSGGSILNGALAARWSELTPDADGVFTNLSVVADAVRGFCARDLRTATLVGTRVNPLNAVRTARNLGAVPADALVKPYEQLTRGTRLADLPASPRFVFCATSVQTGACWHFHGGPDGRMGDFYTGYFGTGRTRLSEAVAASSAFPPGFAALSLDPGAPPDRTDPWGMHRVPSPKVGRVAKPAAGKRVLLTDGGVYDNLGVEPVWTRCRTLVVSDAGHPFSAEGNVNQSAIPRLMRVADISAEQVGAVRKRWMIERIQLGGWMNAVAAASGGALPAVPGAPEVRAGTLWGIDTRPRSYAHALGLPATYADDVLNLIAAIRTDLNAFTTGEQGALQNHGYWLANAGITQYAAQLATRPAAPFAWPVPAWAPGAPTLKATLAKSNERGVMRDIFRWGVGLFTRGGG